MYCALLNLWSHTYDEELLLDLPSSTSISYKCIVGRQVYFALHPLSVLSFKLELDLNCKCMAFGLLCCYIFMIASRLQYYEDKINYVSDFINLTRFVPSNFLTLTPHLYNPPNTTVGLVLLYNLWNFEGIFLDARLSM